MNWVPKREYGINGVHKGRKIFALSGVLPQQWLIYWEWITNMGWRWSERDSSHATNKQTWSQRSCSESSVEVVMVIFFSSSWMAVIYSWNFPVVGNCVSGRLLSLLGGFSVSSWTHRCDKAWRSAREKAAAGEIDRQSGVRHRWEYNMTTAVRHRKPYGAQYD